ncbi:MAG: hypothetical protein GEU95_05630 [Rhizobiales bacterium]|nr:hypothetical protein [Hyphomicrobiales bacterium]
MASGGALPLDRLRQFLRELRPGARALLVAELERAVLRGDDIPGGDMLLQEVRAAVRDSGARAPRMGAPARAFFRPLEPFLNDAQNDRKALARISRAALDPIWTWIARDLAPAETQTYSDDVNRALVAVGSEPPHALAHSFQELVAARMHAALEASRSDDKARRKMLRQITTPHALDDIKDIQAILAARDTLDLIANRLPGHIRNLGDSTLDYVKGLLDAPLCARQGLQPYALVMVANRLAAPWQLIRLGVKAADSDDAARIAASPYALAVTITLGDIARMIDELKSDLKRDATVAVTALLKCIHDAVRGVRSELDLSADSPWARQLAAIRSEISNVLKAEIESIPGRVRRLLRPRPLQDIPRGSVLDADEVAETAAMIAFVGACRNYAGELAASEVTLRTFQELQQYLDSGTRALLDALRAATEHDRPFRKSQMDAAIAFCGQSFGKDYAALLTKAAEMAEHAERKVAVRA